MKNNFIQKELKSNLPIFNHRDLFATGLGALIIAGLLCSYAYKGGMLIGMTTGEFYVAFFTFLFIIILVLLYIRWCIRRLDRKQSWLDDWFMRLAYQMALCWLIPSLVLFALYTLVHKLLSTDILASGLLDVDLPWFSILLLVVNLLHIIAFFVRLNDWHKRMRNALMLKCRHYYNLIINERKKNGLLEKENQELRDKFKALTEQHRIDIEQLKEQLNKQKEEQTVGNLSVEEVPLKTIKSYYTLRTSKLTSRYIYGDLACFIYEKPYTYLKTIDGKPRIPANEASLKEAEEVTDGFFRKITRNMAVPQHMIADCKRLKDGRLQLQLKAPLNSQVRVSKKTAALLEDWILEAVKEIKKKDGDV